jgi:trimethylamine-N-oxide reductase (cytochrome c)
LEGNSEEDLVRKLYGLTNIPLSYEEFKEKGYYVWPHLDDYQPHKQFEFFYHHPVGIPAPGPAGRNVVDTPTGKIEIYSTLIHAFYGDDNPEIPCVPHYIPEREGRYDEKHETYPLQMLMAHPKYRFHGKYNDIQELSENYKVYGPEGYPYEPCSMHPRDAKARGLKDGDIVRAFNDRGQVLAGVVITERLVPGCVWLTYGAWNDPLTPSHDAIDRGGDGNVLSYSGSESVHHVGGAYNSVLIEVEKADLEALARQYPDGMAGRWSSWKKGGRA